MFKPGDIIIINKEPKYTSGDPSYISGIIRKVNRTTVDSYGTTKGSSFTIYLYRDAIKSNEWYIDNRDARLATGFDLLRYKIRGE